jgi:hypothetical protein
MEAEKWDMDGEPKNETQERKEPKQGPKNEDHVTIHHR